MPVHALDSEDHSSLLVRKVVPLAGNPELEVISTQLGKGWTREYRVDNVRTLDSGRRISGNNASGWIDFLLAAAAVWLIYSQRRLYIFNGDWTVPGWDIFRASPRLALTVALAVLIVIRRRVTLHQSVLTLPHLGIQLSTTRQLRLPFVTKRRITLSTSNQFIPVADVSTVVINEGLHRWSVRYYLAIVSRGGSGVEVAFDLVTPRHAVLREVYHGIREDLFDEWEEE